MRRRAGRSTSSWPGCITTVPTVTAKSRDPSEPVKTCPALDRGGLFIWTPHGKVTRMIDLSTTYLGLKLKNPLVASASPLSKKLDQAKQLEDAGVSAIVMYSLFEEQIIHESLELDHFLHAGQILLAGSIELSPGLGPTTCCPKSIWSTRKLSRPSRFPIIGSLNGVSRGGWVRYARLIQDAGADALELNLYFLPVDPALRAEEIENTQVELVEAVKTSIDIPLAVKLSPYYTSLPHFVHRIAQSRRRRDCPFQPLLPAGLRHRRA